MSLGRLPFLQANSSTASMWANPRCMYLWGQDRITGLQRFGKTLATSKSMRFQQSTSLPTTARPRKSPATPWTANAWPLPSRVSISWGIATAPSRKKPSTNSFLPTGPLGKGGQAARPCWVGLLQTSLLTLSANRPVPTPGRPVLWPAPQMVVCQPWRVQRIARLVSDRFCYDVPLIAERSLPCVSPVQVYV